MGVFYINGQDLLLLLYLFFTVLFVVPVIVRKLSQQLGSRIFDFFAIRLFTRTMTFGELLLLSSSKADRAGFIKDYYDFRRQDLLAMVKGVGALLLLNAGSILKNRFESDCPKDNDLFLIIGTCVLLLVNGWLLFLLRKAIRDFKLAMMFYQSLI